MLEELCTIMKSGKQFAECMIKIETQHYKEL